jgi:putative transposase
MEVTRVARVRIGLPKEAARGLIQSYTDACNFASRLAFSLPRPSSALDLQKVAYEGVRSFGLTAQIAVSVCRAVSSKYATLKQRKHTPNSPVRFREEPVQLQGGERGRDFRFAKEEVSLSTLSGRVKVPFRGPPRLGEYLSSWKMGGARLLLQNKKVYLLVSFSRQVEEVSRPNNAVVGVDRGLKQIAVATDGKRACFFGGGPVLFRKRHYRKLRASLQSRKARKSTRSLRKLVRRLRGREARFQTNSNHVVSKRIVEFAKKAGCPTIALENLKGIRDRVRLSKQVRRWVGGWAFYQLQQFIEYKAKDQGFGVVYVDPRGSSKGCSLCGHTEEANRKGLLFCCKACSYRLHADLNASRNVRLRGILVRQAPHEEGAQVSRPKSSGLSGTSRLL